jgi:hypothetical protein
MDNRLPPADLSNLVSHQHVYEIKGGPTFWAQCECGDKFNRGNGAVCGSRVKVLAAIP